MDENHQTEMTDKSDSSALIGELDYSGEGTLKKFHPLNAEMPTAEDFEFIKPISKGAFGKVWLGYKQDKPDTIYAIKVMKKEDLIRKNLIAQVTAERDVQARSRSPYIVQLFYSIQTRQNILLVMEYMIGGDVKSLLIMYGFFPEEMACFYAAEVTLALKYLHKRGIVHRDLKPDNMLISETGHIKLTDFGLSKVTVDYASHGGEGFTPCIARGGGRERYLDLRTPGQIRSLSSSLAFSTLSSHKKLENSSKTLGNSETCFSEIGDVLQTSTSQDDDSQDNQEGKKSLTPPQTDQRFMLQPQPQTPAEKGQKLHLAKLMLTPSSTLPLPVNKLTGMTPPVQSLTPTLQDSLTWRTSSASDSKSRVACSLLQYSLLSRSAARQSCSFAGGGKGNAGMAADESLDKMPSPLSSDLCSESSNCILENSLESSVFSPDVDYNTHQCQGKSRCGNSCDASAELQLSCDSHIMPIYRLEGEKDTTPLLHRKHDSVLKSFSAQNLRLMTKGSYSDTNCSLTNDGDDEEMPAAEVKVLDALEEENYNPGLDRFCTPDLSCPKSELIQSLRNNNRRDMQCNFSTANQESPITEHQDSAEIGFLSPDFHDQSKNLSSTSQERARAVLSALDESLGDIHQLRPQSIAASTDLDLSSDFSTHLQKDRNLNSTRLSMDFGPLKISLDFGSELKDLSHVSGLGRLPLHPIIPKANTYQENKSKTGASRGSVFSDVEPEQSALLIRKKSVKETAIGQLAAPGSGGHQFRRRLTKPGLRRVLSETFDKCVLSESESAELGKNLLHNKSKSQEIPSSTQNIMSKEMKEDKDENVLPRSPFQRKRSCQEALMETLQDMPEPKMQCKINLPSHTGLTPDLRRLAMRNNVHNNHQLTGDLISDLFRVNSKGISLPESPAKSNLFHSGVALKPTAAFVNKEVLSSTKLTGPTHIMGAQCIGGIDSNLTKENCDSLLRMDKGEQSFSPYNQIQTEKVISGPNNSEGKDLPKQKTDSGGLSLHRVPACTNLALCCEQNSQVLSLAMGANVSCSSPDSPRGKQVKFYMDSPSPCPTRHSSPASGSNGSKLPLPPLIIKKGISTNDSLGQDGSFLNMSIEFEVPESKNGVHGSPKYLGSPHQSLGSHLNLLTPADKKRSTRKRSLSSNTSVLSDIEHEDDDTRISLQPVPVNPELLLHSPPLTFSKEPPQLMSNSDQGCASMQRKDGMESVSISDGESRLSSNGQADYGNNPSSTRSERLSKSPKHPLYSTEMKKAEHQMSDGSAIFPRPNSMPLLAQTPKPAASTKDEAVFLQFKTPLCTPVALPGKSLPFKLLTHPHTPATRTPSHAGVWPMGTPLRTPKSVRRGREPPASKIDEERILGTPDYLAPEILLHQQHGFAVDWWALGVCLYEFLTGLPPFNDETPEAVFANILNRDITWPEDDEALSLEAQAAVEALLTVDPKKRPAAQETMNMPFFSDIDWANLLDVEPLFVPQPDDKMDTTYFKPKNDQRNLVMSAVDL